MGIGSVTSWSPMPGTRTAVAGSADTKSKSIQKEINDVQQKMQKLSSREEFSVSEKANERKKLQKEISSLNTQLKQHKEELLKSQKREAMLAELREEQEAFAERAEQKGTKEQGNRGETVLTRNSDGTVTLKEEKSQGGKPGVEPEEEKRENIDADLSENSRKDMHTMVSAEHSIQRANRQGAVIARIRDGIVILKGEIGQDERYGADTGRKQAELEKMESKEQRARAFQFSDLGQANSTVRSAAKAKLPGAKDRAQETQDKNLIQIFDQNQVQQQQRFQISFGT